MPLNGAGVIEDNILEDNEEKMHYRSCDVRLSRIRNAVRLAGRFEEQKTQEKIKSELTCVILCAKVLSSNNLTARRAQANFAGSILSVPACFVKHKGALIYDRA